MPVITEDVLQEIQGRKCDGTDKGYMENNYCLNEEKANSANQISVNQQILPSGHHNEQQEAAAAAATTAV